MQLCLIALWFSIATSWLATIVSWVAYLVIVFYDSTATVNIFGYEIYLQVIILLFAIIATFYAALFTTIWAAYEEFTVRLRLREKRIPPVVIPHQNIRGNARPSSDTTQYPHIESIPSEMEQQQRIYPDYGTIRNGQQVRYPVVYYGL